MTTIRRKDADLPNDLGPSTTQTHSLVTAPGLMGTSLANMNSMSRRTALSVIAGPLAPHSDALTLIGGQAVMLRTTDRYELKTTTEDADFAITPHLVTNDPNIETALTQAGFVLRHPDRPGLWGRNPRIDPLTQVTAYDDEVDIDCPMALSGAISRKRRSVPALFHHGKRTVGTGDGLELATANRSLIDVPDLLDPGRSVRMWVADQPALICAKSFKLAERMYGTGRGILLKDYLDLFLLMDSADQDEVGQVFTANSQDPVIGESVRRGVAHFMRLVGDPTVRERVSQGAGGRIPAGELDHMLGGWAHFMCTITSDWRNKNGVT